MKPHARTQKALVFCLFGSFFFITAKPKKKKERNYRLQTDKQKINN